MGKYNYFFGDLPKLKVLWYFEIFVNTGPYGAGSFDCYSSYSFQQISAKLYEDIGYHADHGRTQAITFLAICQVYLLYISLFST